MMLDKISSPKYHHTYCIIVWSLYKFYGQPDDGPLTRPKHVVVSYISLLSDIVGFIDYVYIDIYTHYILCSIELKKFWKG